MRRIKTIYHNHLPHIAPIGATFFVTFRLADSLPRSLVVELKKKMDNKIARLKKEKPYGYEETIQRQKKIFFKNYDHQLGNKPYGECYLKKREIAEVVVHKLHELDKDKYELIAYCIMPNHVHLLFDTSVQLLNKDGLRSKEIPEDYFQLHQIMKTIKGSTANAANKLLGRKGTFWQKDSYDHYIRNDREFWNIIRYILDNPVKAKLVDKWQDYPFTYIADKYN